MKIQRPQSVVLELEDLPDTHTAIPQYIKRLEDCNGMYLSQAESRYNQVKFLDKQNTKLKCLLMDCLESMADTDNPELTERIEIALAI